MTINRLCQLIAISLCMWACLIYSAMALAEQEHIYQHQYPQFERYLLLSTCESIGMATHAKTQAQARVVEHSDSDAMKSVRRGAPYVLDYIGPDNSARLMYMVEGILYYGPAQSAMICSKL